MPSVSSIRLALIALVALVVLGPDIAAAQSSRSLNGLSAEAFLLIDSSGREVFSKNADEDRAPASLTKMMTLYLAYEDIEGGRANLDVSPLQQVTCDSG